MKQVRLWAYQTDISGNVNSHFNTLELGVDSTEADVQAHAKGFYWKCFNIQNLGVLESQIPDVAFCPKEIGELP